jgi:hypothetical protein
MKGIWNDVTGRRFGKLVALHPVKQSRQGWHWVCQCDCGNKHTVAISHLGRSTNSCGCFRREDALRKIAHTHTGATKDRKRWLLWNSAKCRAKKQGVPFDIVVEDILIPKTCPFLEIPLKFAKKKIHFDSPTLDKIIPKLGYVKGNIRVISAKANWMKGSASLEEFETVARNWRRLASLG